MKTAGTNLSLAGLIHSLYLCQVYKQEDMTMTNIKEATTVQSAS